MLKHGSDQGRNFLQRAQTASNTLLKMSKTFDGKLADLVVLEIPPYQFVGVQVRRVSRQKEQAKAPIRFCGKLPDRLATMSPMAVCNQEDRGIGIEHQSPDELDVHRDLEAAFKAHETELTAWTDRRDEIHLEARAGGLDHRCLADRCPGRAAVIVRANSRFVDEENLHPTAFGLPDDCRILAPHPGFAQFRGALVSPREPSRGCKP